MVLVLFPNHYAALAGKGLSYRDLGDDIKTEVFITKAIELHPWASHVPAILNRIKWNQSKIQQQTNESKDPVIENLIIDDNQTKNEK